MLTIYFDGSMLLVLSMTEQYYSSTSLNKFLGLFLLMADACTKFRR